MSMSKQTTNYNEIFIKKFKELCQQANISPREVRKLLHLPNNYVNLLGAVRIADFFKVNISDLIKK